MGRTLSGLVRGGIMVSLRFRKVGVLLGALSISTAVIAADILGEAKELLAQGKNAQAYALLAPAELERAGDTAFDLLLGQAALGTGQNTRAIFALERVLQGNPGHRQARYDLARALFASGDYAAATQAFEAVRKQDGQNVDPLIDDYLLRARQSGRNARPSLSGFGELRIGYDTNANAGPQRDSVDMIGVPVVLTAAQRASDDAFAGLAAGVKGRLPLTESLTLLGEGAGSLRMHRQENQFDFATYEARAGLKLARGRHVFSLLGHYAGLNVDDRAYRSMAGVTGQWQFEWDAVSRIATYLQYSDVS